MPTANDVAWFKQNFGAMISAGVAGTPFDLDMMTALACQETGEVWPILRRVQPALSIDQIAALCVGDVIDAPNRSAFPKTKADLVAARDGQRMFEIAHQALVDMAAYIKGYQPYVKPNKFCHGYGIWQYDLQFFKEDPAYFLEQKYADAANSLGKAIEELTTAMGRAGLSGRASLTDYEMACVAIAYNTGGFKPAKGLRQGFYDRDADRYYGEYVYDFIRLSRSVAAGAAPGQPTPGAAIVPPPSPISATGPTFRVQTQSDPLRLRSAPEISDPSGANVIAQMPDGQLVRSITGKASKGFMEVETTMNGALLRGFASAKYLVPADPAVAGPALALAVSAAAAPAAAAAAAGIVAVYAPSGQNQVTRRKDQAGARSLNEPKQPGRQGTNPAELVAELNAIIDWLDVENGAYARYQPRDGLTFCNIYAHDYVHLAGAYLPRVWWTQKSLIALAQGQAVTPVVGATVDEVRANDLFRWLRDFGLQFGWRQTGSLTSLQQNANQGGLGLIVARRTEDGKSGHIVAIAPESNGLSARRDSGGQVIAPLQSQAGARNFRRGTGALNWWGGAQFAESAFWIHA